MTWSRTTVGIASSSGSPASAATSIGAETSPFGPVATSWNGTAGSGLEPKAAVLGAGHREDAADDGEGVAGGRTAVGMEQPARECRGAGGRGAERQEQRRCESGDGRAMAHGVMPPPEFACANPESSSGFSSAGRRRPARETGCAPRVRAVSRVATATGRERVER